METTRKQKVLLTYMESGMGHITSVKSISDNLKKFYNDQFEINDCYIMQEDNNKYLKKFNKFIIKQTQNTNKHVGFGKFIFIFLKMMGGLKFMRFIHRTFFSKALNAILQAFKKRDPDIIISTHYFMTFAGLEYRKKVNPNCKIITYNPDNNVHLWWDNRPHLFIVNNEKAYYDAIGKMRFNPALVKQVNFIARNDIINANKTRQEYREELNIPQDKFCVIVADGIYACAKSHKITKELLKTDKQITIIMLAGKNEKLLKYYQNLAKSGKLKSNITLIPLEFTKEVYKYYKAANVFITKAGPNAILDSVFMGTPVLVDYYAHPIEKVTTKLFTEEYKVGKAIYNAKKIRKQVELWIENDAELKEFESNTKAIDKFKSGGQEISDLIFAESKRKVVTDFKDDYENYLYEFANNKQFDLYTTPMNYNNSEKLKSYKQLNSKGILKSASRVVVKGFIKLIAPVVDFCAFGFRVKGRKNLKGIKSAITISNHVHYLDALWNLQVLSHKKNVHITAAPHNNKKGLGGKILRAGGIVPIFTSVSEARGFDEFIANELSKGGIIHFYPEKSLWLRYEQSRELKRGAFVYAVKNNVPIIPIIYCFKKSAFRRKKKVIAEICKPIYPDKNLKEHEDILRLQKLAQQVYDNKIIEFYGYDKTQYSMDKNNKTKA